MFVSNEGYLSVPQMRANVELNVEIVVSYLDRNGVQGHQTIRGYSARTWQHEYAHLDGILFAIRVTDLQTFCSWQVFHTFQQQDATHQVNKLIALLRA